MRVLKIVRLLRLLKILRILRASRILKRFEANNPLPPSLKAALGVMVKLLVSSHWISCAFALVGKGETEGTGWSWIDARASGSGMQISSSEGDAVLLYIA